MKTSDERITELEIAVTHLQRTVSELDQSIVDLHRRLEHSEREVRRLSSDLRLAREMAFEARRPEDEKPPHY